MEFELQENKYPFTLYCFVISCLWHDDRTRQPDLILLSVCMARYLTGQHCLMCAKRKRLKVVNISTIRIYMQLLR